MKLPENDRKALFALLAVVAIAAAAYAFLLAPPADKPSDWEHFVSSVGSADEVGLFMDARGTDIAVARKIFQCGTDIILSGREIFGGRTVNTYACDDTGCVSATSASNATNKLTPDTVMGKLRGQPYMLIKKGQPDTKIFERHVEIYIDETYAQGCVFSVKVAKQ